MERKLFQKKKRLKLGNEEFIVEDFKDEDNFDEELNQGERVKEIVLKNEDENNPKIIKQKVFLKSGENYKQAGTYRELNQASKFKNGFSFNSRKVFVGRSVIIGGNKKNKK